MADNDVFTVLGKVEVDNNALKASLTNAEAEVKKSADRMAATWAKASKDATNGAGGGPGGSGGPNSPFSNGPKGPGGTWWSDPNMAFGGGDKGPAGTLGKLGEGAKKAGEGVHFTMLETRALGHVLSMAVPGIHGMGLGFAAVLTHLGPIGLGLAVLATTFGILAKRAEEVAKVNYEIKRSLATEDFGRLSGALTKANEALAEQQDLAERANQQWNSLQSTVDIVVTFWRKTFANAVGEGAAKQEEHIKKFKAGLVEAFEKFEGPKRLREALKELNEVQAQVAQRQISMADTAADVESAYGEFNKTLQKTHDFTIQDIEDQVRQEAKRLGAVEGTKLYAQIRESADKKIEAADKRLNEQLASGNEEQKKKLAELATAQVEYTNKLLAENSKRYQSAQDLRKVEIDSAKAMLQLQAQAAGQTADTSEAISDSYTIQIRKIRESEDTAAKASKSIVENLKAQVAAGIDVVKNQNAIGEEEAKRETSRQEAQNKVKTLGIQRQGELAQESRRVFEAEMGRVKSVTEAYFSERKAFGKDTIADEIKFQKALNNLYVKGTAEYYNGLAKVSQLQKQMRDDAKSTFQQITEAATASLKKKFPGRTKFSASEIQAEAGNVEAANNKILGDFGSNKQVDTDALQRALNQQGGFENFASKGGNLRDLFDKAITPGGQGFAAAGTSTFAGGAPEQDLSKLMKSSADMFGSGVADFREAVATFASAMRSVSNPDLSQASLSSTIGRTAQLESKRAPAPQTTLS